MLWLAKVLTLVVLFIVVPFMLLIIAVGAAAKTQKNVAAGENVVAVVEVTGMITSSKDILKQLHEHVDNEKVKGIVLRVDSPGGAVAPSQDIFAAVGELKKRKPIVVSMGSMAASGGLYSSLSASKIFCEPGTLTGSIGVIVQLPNVQQIADKVGFNMVTIKSGELKDVGNMFRQMSDREREYLESVVMAIRSQFVAAVAAGRGLDKEKVETFADGRVLTGEQAIELGLADKIGTVYDAAREVFELLGKPLPAGKTPTLYYASDKFAQFRKLLESVLDLPLRLKSGREVRILYLA